MAVAIGKLPAYKTAMRYSIAATNLGDVFALGMKLFRNNARPVCILGLLLSLPQLSFLLLPLFDWNTPTELTIRNLDGTTTTLSTAGVIGLSVALFQFFVLHPLAKGAMVLVFTGDLMREPMAWQRALHLAWKRKFALWGSEMMAYWIAFFGAMLVLVPGVYFILRYALTIQAVMLEGARPVPSLGRSGALMRGHYLRTLGLVVMLLGLNLALSSVTTSASEIIGILAAWLLQAAIIALTTALFTAMYFATRSKHEQFETMVAGAAPRSDEQS